MKKVLLLASILALLPLTTNAITIVGLGIDRSGSINSSDFQLQINAYKSAIADTSVIPLDSSVAIGVWSFGSSVNEHFAPSLIDSNNIGDLLTSFDSIPSGGLTALGSAIDTISSSILGFAQPGDRTVIDISTDGRDTTGGNPDVSSANAIAAGIDQVNGLGVGLNADLSFIGGVDSFAISVDNFSDFEDAIKRKLRIEAGGSPIVVIPPSPISPNNPTSVPDSHGTIGLLFLSFAGLLFGRKKMNSNRS
ncbi:DUF1194 domain-containing protein [Puniceicoccaceae bacterium K14]|nr:DUF1194 domain-containing protein [Puniceicoccaceae bacterium K14]